MERNLARLIPKDPRPVGFFILYPTPALTFGPSLRGPPGVPCVPVSREFTPQRQRLYLRNIVMVNAVYQPDWAEGHSDGG